MKKAAALLLAVACLSLYLTGYEKSAYGDELDGRETYVSKDADSAETALPEASKLVDEDLWGVSLTAKNITQKGLTLVFTQSGGKPAGQLQTGSPFWMERFTDGQWEKVETVIPESEIAWTMEAYWIPVNGCLEQETTWSYLYGELPEGSYRIGKEVMDFRATGDYDISLYYVSFEIPS